MLNTINCALHFFTALKHYKRLKQKKKQKICLKCVCTLHVSLTVLWVLGVCVCVRVRSMPYEPVLLATSTNSHHHSRGAAAAHAASAVLLFHILRRRFQLQHLFCFLLPFLMETTMRSFCSSTALRSFCFSTCRVMDINMSSTLRLSLADVSNSSISICRAKRCASSVITTLRSGSSFLFPTANRRVSKHVQLN